MLCAGPEIHGNCTKLYLYRHLVLVIRKIHVNQHYHMKTPVAILLRFFYVVLYCDNLDIRLIHKHIGHLIYIGYKWTNDPDAGYILYLTLHGIGGERNALSLHFVYYTVKRLYTALYVLDWISFVIVFEFII